MTYKWNKTKKTKKRKKSLKKSDDKSSKQAIVVCVNNSKYITSYVPSHVARCSTFPPTWRPPSAPDWAAPQSLTTTRTLAPTRLTPPSDLTYMATVLTSPSLYGKSENSTAHISQRTQRGRGWHYSASTEEIYRSIPWRSSARPVRWRRHVPRRRKRRRSSRRTRLTDAASSTRRSCCGTSRRDERSRRRPPSLRPGNPKKRCARRKLWSPANWQRLWLNNIPLTKRCLFHFNKSINTGLSFLYRK